MYAFCIKIIRMSQVAIKICCMWFIILFIFCMTCKYVNKCFFVVNLIDTQLQCMLFFMVQLISLSVLYCFALSSGWSVQQKVDLNPGVHTGRPKPISYVSVELMLPTTCDSLSGIASVFISKSSLLIERKPFVTYALNALSAQIHYYILTFIISKILLLYKSMHLPLSN